MPFSDVQRHVYSDSSETGLIGTDLAELRMIKAEPGPSREANLSTFHWRGSQGPSDWMTRSLGMGCGKNLALVMHISRGLLQFGLLTAG